MKTILCYGDSNTWGFNPRTQGRHDHKTRWPMKLASILNEGSPPDDPLWWVVEEGQNGRTSCREDPVEGDRNGLRQLLPILESHKPIDLVAVMLGTNDLKPRFNPSPFDIARGVQRVIDAVRESKTGPGGGSPQALMICPPPTLKSPVFKHVFGDGCAEMSKELPSLYRVMAFESGVHFLDAGKHIKSSEADGIHLDPEAHCALAEAVAEIVRGL
ncbi:MAG: SGNH/GDSL hydrolase family protein [Treponema sp.]|jgi:lysophospholipase L1-like esterase|nr:SGNH/GDSL hydrolase family protein [Treponema sp.]